MTRRSCPGTGPLAAQALIAPGLAATSGVTLDGAELRRPHHPTGVLRGTTVREPTIGPLGSYSGDRAAGKRGLLR